MSSLIERNLRPRQLLKRVYDHTIVGTGLRQCKASSSLSWVRISLIFLLLILRPSFPIILVQQPYNRTGQLVSRWIDQSSEAKKTISFVTYLAHIRIFTKDLGWDILIPKVGPKSVRFIPHNRIAAPLISSLKTWWFSTVTGEASVCNDDVGTEVGGGSGGEVRSRSMELKNEKMAESNVLIFC